MIVCWFQPKAVMVSCIDSRIIMTRLLQSSVGDMLLVRNAGNVVPHSDSLRENGVSTEAAALELGCVVNNIRHVVVCGHSDCKVRTHEYTLARTQKHADSPDSHAYTQHTQHTQHTQQTGRHARTHAHTHAHTQTHTWPHTNIT